MQSIGNVEHTCGKQADLPIWPGGAPVELRDGVNCSAIPCNATTSPVDLRPHPDALSEIWTSLGTCAGAEKFRELIDDAKPFRTL